MEKQIDRSKRKQTAQLRIFHLLEERNSEWSKHHTHLIPFFHSSTAQPCTLKSPSHAYGGISEVAVRLPAVDGVRVLAA